MKICLGVLGSSPHSLPILTQSKLLLHKFLYFLIGTIASGLTALLLFHLGIHYMMPNLSVFQVQLYSYMISIVLTILVGWSVWRHHLKLTRKIIRESLERASATEALRESEERLFQVTTSIGVVFWMMDLENNEMVYISPAYEKIWGQTCEHLYKNPDSWTDGIHPEDRERVIKAAVEKQAKGDYDETYRVVRPDGTIRWIHDRGYPVKSADGKVRRVTGIARDITEQVRAEKQSQLWMKVLESAANGVVITNEKGVILWVNPAMTRLTGYESAELIGQHTKLLKSGKQDQAYYEVLWDTILSGKVWHNEIINLRKDGSFYFEDMMITPVKMEGDKITHFVAIKQDITERKKAESERRELQLKLFQTEKLSTVGELTSGVAHEINNPLTAVIGLSDLMLEEETDLEKKKDLQTIKEQSVRCSKIVQNLLHFARQHNPEIVPTDLNEVLEKTYSLISYNARSSSIKLEMDLQSQLPITLADPNHLQQVFLNIFNNAIHAVKNRPNPLLTIRSRYERGAIVIKISDNGYGIPAELLSRVFDPFFTTKPPGEGTGLGLSVSYGILKDHGGSIQVESEPDKGACFTIEIPVKIPK